MFQSLHAAFGNSFWNKVLVGFFFKSIWSALVVELELLVHSFLCGKLIHQYFC